VLKNKHQAVSQGVRRFGKRSISAICEHLQKPHNAGSRPQARFFNTLSGLFQSAVRHFIVLPQRETGGKAIQLDAA